MRRHSTITLGLLAFLLPMCLGQGAAVSTGNPQGAQYIAALPPPLSGSVVASSLGNGTVGIQVSLSRLPSSGGPFSYIINTNPVASNGSCATTGVVLDPYKGVTPCNSSDSSECQIGDLSGKHGTMPGPNFAANYIDQYLSTIVGSPAFVGNRSLIVLTSNGTAIACANFSMGGSSSRQSSDGLSPSAMIQAVPIPVPLAPGLVVASSSSSTISSLTQAVPPKDMSISTATPPEDMSTLLSPPPGPGGNLVAGLTPSAARTDKDPKRPAELAAPSSSNSTSSPAPTDKDGKRPAELAVPRTSIFTSSMPMSDGCNSTSPAPVSAPTPPPSTLKSTPGVVPGFIPSLNDPPATVTTTTTVNNTSLVAGPVTTVTDRSNSTGTVKVLVPQNATTTTSSSPTPSPVCGTGMETTLPNGSVATVLVGPSNGTAPGSAVVITVTRPVVTTITGGPHGTTVTLPRSPFSMLGMTIGRPGHRSRITVPADSTVTVTLPASSTPSTVTYTSYPSSSFEPSMRTITVPPSSASVVTVPASSSPPNVVTVVAGPVGTTVTLPDNTVVRLVAGATSVLTVPPTNNLLTQVPTISIFQLLGGKSGMTTSLPAITSVVQIPAGETSEVTLPASTPGLDETTLLGGVDGLTTVLPDLPLETPDMPLLDNPDYVTDTISPPDATPIIGPPPDVGDLSDAARPTVGTSAWIGVIAGLGLAVFVM